MTKRFLAAIFLATIAAAGQDGLAQGRCMTTFGAPTCVTTDIPPVFASTGWKTVALEQITFRTGDYKKEAAFYAALMGFTPRSDDGTQAVMDVGDWGTVIFKQAPDTKGAVIESFGYVIDKWDARKVESELKARGLSPVADNSPSALGPGGKGFESFHVKDPDGFDLQIANGNGHSKRRKSAEAARLSEPAPFASTGWKTVWLDHFSYNAADYKKSASFYMNLLGWQPTYDEGSQHELKIGEVADIIIRGGNPLSPEFGKANARGERARIDHISLGIAPWDTDAVKAELEKRGLKASIDTSSRHKNEKGEWVADEIHTAAFKSYHTATPNGYNLQISYVTHDNRLALANAVNPKKVSGGGQ
jgi:catechol 2,3-dioxygenase-like lactoylglutathione lyase family enzyme